MKSIVKKEDFSRKVRRKYETWQGLSITSLVDILTILLVFLLKNVSMEVQRISIPGNMEFPVTMAQRDLMDNKGTTLIQIFKDRILIGEEDYYDFGTPQEFKAQKAKREAIKRYLTLTAAEILKEKDAEGKPVNTTALLIKADRSIPCEYITALVKYGTDAKYQLIYFAALIDQNWLQQSKQLTGS